MSVRNATILAIVALVGLGCAGVASEEAPATRRQLRTLVEEYDRAIGLKDREKLRALMSEEFTYFTSSGGVRTRSEFLDFLTSEAYQPEFRERSEIMIRFSTTTAVIGSRWRGRGTYAGQGFDDDQRCSLTVSRIREEWRLASEHCTPIRN